MFFGSSFTGHSLFEIRVNADLILSLTMAGPIIYFLIVVLSLSIRSIDSEIACQARLLRRVVVSFPSIISKGDLRFSYCLWLFHQTDNTRINLQSSGNFAIKVYAGVVKRRQR